MVLGKKSYWSVPHYDENTEQFSQTHNQYCGHIFKANKYSRIHTDGYSNDKERSFKRLARIPASMFAEMGERIAPNGVIDQKELIKWLDSTREGQLCKVVEGRAKDV